MRGSKRWIANSRQSQARSPRSTSPPETDVALAVEREQASELFLTRLHALTAAIESMRQHNADMLTPLDRAGFTRLGFGAVGRETLVASMREIGASSTTTLAGRYGVHVQVTFDENGNPESAHAGTNTGVATTVGYALTQTGNPYGVAAGVVLILGGIALDGDCVRKWDKQRETPRRSRTHPSIQTDQRR